MFILYCIDWQDHLLKSVTLKSMFAVVSLFRLLLLYPQFHLQYTNFVIMNDLLNRTGFGSIKINQTIPEPLRLVTLCAVCYVTVLFFYINYG